ncbi:Mitochondrial carrier protein [Plasmodiophora brassicae]
MKATDTQRGPLGEIGLAAAAACSATLFSNPLEVVKTRMQLQGELSRSAAASLYRTPWQAVRTIIATEGATSLQKGLAPALLYTAVMNGLRLGLYAPVKSMLANGNDDGAVAFVKSMAAGAASGVAGAGLASPAFLIKVRLQMQGSAGAGSTIGYQHNYGGVLDAATKIVRADGIAGLWAGSRSQMLRVAVGSAVQLPSYDAFKAILLMVPGVPNGTVTHLIASTGGGLLVAVAMNPFDLVTSRVMNQPTVNGKGALYDGIVDCMLKTARSEGLLALFKGLPAHAMRVAPHTILTFVFWEHYKRLAASRGY